MILLCCTRTVAGSFRDSSLYWLSPLFNVLQGCHPWLSCLFKCPSRLSPWLSPCSTMSSKVVVHDCLLVQQCPARLLPMTVSFFHFVENCGHDWLIVQHCPSRLMPMCNALQGCGPDVFVFSFTLHLESIWAPPPFVSHFWLSFWTVADLFLSQGFRKGVSNFTAYSQNLVRKAVYEVVCGFWKWETYGWLTTHVLSFWFTSGRHISPEVDRLSGQYNDVRFLKVDLDEVPIFLADFLISKNIAMGCFSILS